MISPTTQLLGFSTLGCGHFIRSHKHRTSQTLKEKNKNIALLTY